MIVVIMVASIVKMRVEKNLENDRGNHRAECSSGLSFAHKSRKHEIRIRFSSKMQWLHHGYKKAVHLPDSEKSVDFRDEIRLYIRE